MYQLSIAGLYQFTSAGDIQALTPQAKGRVERLFQTLQDRLVKAMRLAGVDDLAGANAFLPEYLEGHNQRFAIAPAEEADAHLRYEGSAAGLARTCALHHPRTLSKDLVLSFNKQRYIVQTGGAPRYALRGQPVSVVSYAGGRIEILYGDEVLDFKVFDVPKKDSAPVDSKTVNARVDDILKSRWSEKVPSSPPNTLGAVQLSPLPIAHSPVPKTPVTPRRKFLLCLDTFEYDLAIDSDAVQTEDALRQIDS